MVCPVSTGATEQELPAEWKQNAIRVRDTGKPPLAPPAGRTPTFAVVSLPPTPDGCPVRALGGDPHPLDPARAPVRPRPPHSICQMPHGAFGAPQLELPLAQADRPPASKRHLRFGRSTSPRLLPSLRSSTADGHRPSTACSLRDRCRCVQLPAMRAKELTGIGSDRSTVGTCRSRGTWWSVQSRSRRTSTSGSNGRRSLSAEVGPNLLL